MNILVFTGNAIRHKYVANTLSRGAAKSLTVVECTASDAAASTDSPQSKAFAERYAAEKAFFAGHESFHSPTLPIVRGEVNAHFVLDITRDFKPDLAFVFGSSIIGESLLDTMPRDAFVNLHLGLSPYYRGSGTNFWPFINEELEYVGATLLHIDPGIDTGDIIAHVRPTISEGDSVHSIGNKTIAAATQKLRECIERVGRGEKLPRTPQWKVDSPRYYKKSDITDAVQNEYAQKIESGLITRHLAKKTADIRLVEM